MASAWGSSWGNSWGSAWGSIATPQNAIKRVTTTVQKTGATVAMRATAASVTRRVVTTNSDFDAPTKRH